MSVFDKNENESQATTTPTTISTPTNITTPTTITKKTNIINGHVFKLTCLPIPEGGVQRYALAETGVQ